MLNIAAYNVPASHMRPIRIPRNHSICMPLKLKGSVYGQVPFFNLFVSLHSSLLVKFLVDLFFVLLFCNLSLEVFGRPLFFVRVNLWSCESITLETPSFDVNATVFYTDSRWNSRHNFSDRYAGVCLSCILKACTKEWILGFWVQSLDVVTFEIWTENKKISSLVISLEIVTFGIWTEK